MGDRASLSTIANKGSNKGKLATPSKGKVPTAENSPNLNHTPKSRTGGVVPTILGLGLPSSVSRSVSSPLVVGTSMGTSLRASSPLLDVERGPSGGIVPLRGGGASEATHDARWWPVRKMT